MNIKSTGKTDIGLVRKLNEDYLKLSPGKKLFIVCDGMGGHNAGEVASQSAATMVSEFYGKFYNKLLKDEKIKLPRMFPPSADVLVKSVRIANHCINAKAAADPSLSGMGTTIVAAAIEDDIISLLHVGDSRIYRLFDDKLTALTIDHSWAAELEQTENISSEEASRLVNRNVITRALGIKNSVAIDIAVRKIVAGDIYILCSDGLCGLVPNEEIEKVAVSCNGNIDRIASKLINLANGSGGTDNTTIAVIKITGSIPSFDLPELETVTVEPEPDEYFEIEEQWGEKAENSAPPPGQGKSGSKTQAIAFAVIMIAMVAIFYMIFKG